MPITTSTIQIRTAHCLRCGGSWVTKVEHPKQCNLCKSMLWDTPYVRDICKDRGKVAASNKGETVEKEEGVKIG